MEHTRKGDNVTGVNNVTRGCNVQGIGDVLRNHTDTSKGEASPGGQAEVGNTLRLVIAHV